MRLLTTLLIITLVTGCASHIHPQLKGLDTKDQVVNILGNIQAAAIQLEASSQLSEPNAHYVVSYCNTSLKVIRDSANGWQNAVVELTNELLARPELKRFRIELITIQSIVQELK